MAGCGEAGGVGRDAGTSGTIASGVGVGRGDKGDRGDSICPGQLTGRPPLIK